MVAQSELMVQIGRLKGKWRGLGVPPRRWAAFSSPRARGCDSRGRHQARRRSIHGVERTGGLGGYAIFSVAAKPSDRNSAASSRGPRGHIGPTTNGARDRRTVRSAAARRSATSAKKHEHEFIRCMSERKSESHGRCGAAFAPNTRAGAALAVREHESRRRWRPSSPARVVGHPESVYPHAGVISSSARRRMPVPRFSIVGAVLLTGYLGGAIATHARVGSPR